MTGQSIVSSRLIAAADVPAFQGVRAWAPVVLFVFIVFLLWGTGLATDDYVHLRDALQWRFAEHWWPKEYASIPVLHYTQGLMFYFLGDRPWTYDLLKAVYAGFGVYFASRFFALFCSPRRAVLLGFLFVFFPLHDAANYSLTEFYLIESFTFYLFAYALGAKGRFGLAVLFALLGSFSSYGSPPMAIGLSVLAFLEGRRKLVPALLVPNLIYVVYYLTTSLVFRIGTPRLIGEMTIPALAREYLLKVVTFIDAAVGPSAWAKFYYSITSLDLSGLVVAIVAASAAIWFIRSEQQRTATKSLIFSAAIIVILSFGMFSLTGLYPQISFNLGDRVMIYGGFLIICVLASVRLPRILEAGVVAVTIFAIVGISAHWKQWDRDVHQVADNIRNSQALRALPPDAQVFISHHQYSRLGPFAHIEFFTASYVVRAFFDLQFDGRTPFHLDSFNRRLVYESGSLRDRKFGDIIPVGDAIWLYNSRSNVLERVAASDIQKRIDALPDETRHWTQLIENGWFRSLMARMVPRMSYAY